MEAILGRKLVRTTPPTTTTLKRVINCKELRQMRKKLKIAQEETS
jgi:hypothetical protein